MWRCAADKFPCSRPATYAEYEEGRILGLPEKNTSGAEIVFTGKRGQGDAPSKHKGWKLGGHVKKCVLKDDPLDGSTQVGYAFGRRAVLCVVSARRLVRQASLRSFGDA